MAQWSLSKLALAPLLQSCQETDDCLDSAPEGTVDTSPFSLDSIIELLMAVILLLNKI